jgi:hypothetical protein
MTYTVEELETVKASVAKLSGRIFLAEDIYNRIGKSIPVRRIGKYLGRMERDGYVKYDGRTQSKGETVWIATAKGVRG